MRSLTLRERMIFMANVADNLLNDAGRVKFYTAFYWWLDPNGNITHYVIDRVEKRLAELIQKDEYRK